MIEKICKNCTWYKADYGIYCLNGWSKEGLDGYCHFEPTPIYTHENNKCSYFELKVN